MEEQTKRTILLTIAAFGVVVLVFVGIFYLRSREQNVTDEEQIITEQSTEVENVVENEEVVQEEKIKEIPTQKPPEDSKEAQLKRFTLDFVARFGTYSSDAGSMNLEQLLPLMSGELKTWSQERLANKTTSEEFSGVVTKALSAKVISQTSSDAVVRVSTQRTYTKDATVKIVYEFAQVSLINAGGWRATGVTWEVKPE